MDILTIKEAREEARRFVVMADLLIAQSAGRSLYDFPKECGVVKAQSLLLWRKLAEMRRPG